MSKQRIRTANRPSDIWQPWAMRLPSHATGSSQISPGEDIGRLRLLSGVQILEDANVIWLRGQDLDEERSRTLRSIPNAERFLVMSDGQLTRWDETVPCERMPAGEWQPLAQWMSVNLPTPAFAAIVDRQVPLRLIRSEVPSEANWLRATWLAWFNYSTTAPQIRLSRWSFAVSDSSEVLIRGLPLPPIPGTRLVEQSGVAIPAGCGFDPPLDSQAIHRVLQVPQGEFAVFREEGQIEFVPESVFVRATRSAVRLTDESLRSLKPPT